MTVMFLGARTFKQNLKPWKLNPNVEYNGMFHETPMDSRSVDIINNVPLLGILPNFPQPPVSKGGKKASQSRRRGQRNHKNAARSKKQRNRKNKHNKSHKAKRTTRSLQNQLAQQ
jgi:hypothetical protein